MTHEFCHFRRGRRTRSALFLSSQSWDVLYTSKVLHLTLPQVVASAGNPSDYFLCEEKVPLLKERSEVKRWAQYRPLAPEEEVVRLVHSWNPEEGYVGRICLKTREEVLVKLFIQSNTCLWKNILSEFNVSYLLNDVEQVNVIVDLSSYPSSRCWS